VSAEKDFAHPWMTVIASRDAATLRRLVDLLTPFGGRDAHLRQPGHRRVHQVGAHIFNATKISFGNEMWLVARKMGLDADAIASTVAKSAEGSINPSYGIRGGAPYGGMCLPKDTNGFLGFAETIGVEMPLLSAVVEVNERLVATGAQELDTRTTAASASPSAEQRGWRARDRMDPALWYYVLGTPLGVLGLIRWSLWFGAAGAAVLYTPIGGNFTLPLSVVVPVYQENPEILETAINSWLDNKVDEVILIIDTTDTTCIAIAGALPGHARHHQRAG